MRRLPHLPRYTKTCLILGFVFLFVSFIQGTADMSGRLIYYGNYDGFVVPSNGKIYIEAWGRDERPFSLYILNLDDMIIAIDEGSLDNVTPILTIENVVHYTATIEVPETGWYGILITQTNDSYANMRYDIVVSRGVPHNYLLIPGIFLIGFGILIAMISKHRS